MSAPTANSATNKTEKKCASCEQSLSEDWYASKQWKIGAKRQCRACALVKQAHEQNLLTPNQEKFKSVASLRAHHRCSMCDGPGSAICRHCQTIYCTSNRSRMCLRDHLFSNGDVEKNYCLLQHLKPVKPFPEQHRINEVDKLAVLEINKLMTDLEKKHFANLFPELRSSSNSPFIRSFLPEHLDVICSISSTNNPWWHPDLSLFQQLESAFVSFSQCISNLEDIVSLPELPSDVPASMISLASITTMRDIAISPHRDQIVDQVWQKHARLFHKIIHHWIYFVHNSNTSWRPFEHPLERIHSNEINDKYGILLDARFDPDKPVPVYVGIVYFSRRVQISVLEEEFLTPLAFSVGDIRSKGNPNYDFNQVPAFAAAVREPGDSISCIVTQGGKIKLEGGLVILGKKFYAVPPLYSSQETSSEICFLYAGYEEKSPSTSFRQSPFVATKPHQELMNTTAEFYESMAVDPKVIEEIRMKAAAATERDLTEPGANLFSMLKRNLNDDWPGEEQMSFIPFPAHRIEYAILDILLLQDLMEDAKQIEGESLSSSLTTIQSSSQAAAAVLNSFVAEEHVASASELLEARRKEMQKWIEEAREIQVSAASRRNSRSELATNAVVVPSESQSLEVVSHSISTEAASSSASSSSAKDSIWPDWLRECKGFDEIISKGAVKFDKVRKFVRSLCRDVQLADQLVTNRVGSHVNIHLRGESYSTGITVVDQHTGGKKDRSVSLAERVHLFKRIIGKVMPVNMEEA